MSVPGWYPDPGGRVGHYRYWDGQTWASTTSTSPAGTSPAGTGPGAPSGDTPGGPRRRRGRWGLVAGLAALVLVLVVGGTLVVRDRRNVIVDGGPVPTSTATGDGTSPTVPPSTTSSAVPALPASSSPRAVQPSRQPCPLGDPTARQEHPQDSRIHGGGLSMPTQPGWPSPGPQLGGFSWAYDVGETDIAVQPGWYVAYAVGALSVADGFEDPRSAAELSMACTASSFFAGGALAQDDLVSEAITVGGHRAWTIRAEIRVRNGQPTLTGDTVQITVVDLDSPDALAFFWGCAPIDDPASSARLDQVVEQLRVD